MSQGYGSNKRVSILKGENKMRDQTFGVEIEMNHITRENAATLVAGYFGTTHYFKSDSGVYRIWACKDQKGREWQFERDSSILGPDDEKCEMVTPILKYEDIETLQEIVRILRHAGAKSNPKQDCGVHIHIGAKGQTPQTIRNLVNIMASHEDLLVKALKLDSYRLGRWCKPVDPRFVKAINEKKPTTMTQLADIWYPNNDGDFARDGHYNDSRYHMLNLHATFTKGTIEFRLFQFDNPGITLDGKRYYGGLHAGQLKAYIQLCLALCDRAKKVKHASCKPMQMANQKFAMRTWLVQKLGFVGDEFKTARDILTRNLVGDAAYRYGANGEYRGIA